MLKQVFKHGLKKLVSISHVGIDPTEVSMYPESELVSRLKTTQISINIERINTLEYVHSTEYYKTMNMSKWLPRAAWMNVTLIMLSQKKPNTKECVLWDPVT